MKDERFPIYLSFISTLIFLISTSICYVKINNRVNAIEAGATTAILTFEEFIPMKINPSDLLLKEEKEIAKAIVTLNAVYTNPLDNDYAFKILMKTLSKYNKTSGVDGINSHEYTYEILLDNKVIKKETEINSYDKNDKIELFKTKLKSSNKKRTYQIVFRLYANKYDQTHLMGTNLNSNISIQSVNG
ncbi:MAG: hypothetical protein E7167_04140 [Firmicutes bacterium]|nr:hypothetical protein [Bacillota bacterium]